MPLSPMQMRTPTARIPNPFRMPQCTANAGDLLQFPLPGIPGLNLSNLRGERGHPCSAVPIAVAAALWTLSDHTIDSTLCYRFNGVNAK